MGLGDREEEEGGCRVSGSAHLLVSAWLRNWSACYYNNWHPAGASEEGRPITPPPAARRKEPSKEIPFFSGTRKWPPPPPFFATTESDFPHRPNEENRRADDEDAGGGEEKGKWNAKGEERGTRRIKRGRK